MSILEDYVSAWRQAADDLIELAESLPDDAWSLPTDCPGWTVQDVVAHVAALEGELAGTWSPPPAEDTAAATVSTDHTEAGVEALRRTPPAGLLTMLRTAVERRTEQLEPAPTDPAAPASPTPGGVRWEWHTLLRNRVIDVWVHDQDVRRATDRVGGTDTSAAEITAAAFAAAMPYVLGKRVAPAAGTTVVWDVTGRTPFIISLEVDPAGRAVPREASHDADAQLTMDLGTFTALAAGRGGTDAVEVSGDDDLARRVLGAMAVTS